jgi:hypothetical protein
LLKAAADVAAAVASAAADVTAVDAASAAAAEAEFLSRNSLFSSFSISGGMANIGVRQEVAMDSLKFHPGPPCPTPLRPAGGPSLKRPYSRFRGGLLAGRTAVFYPFGHLTPTMANRGQKQDKEFSSETGGSPNCLPLLLIPYPFN